LPVVSAIDHEYFGLNLSPFAATHGSGIGLVNMAAMVTKLELINGEGKILTLSPQNNKDFFNAAQVFVLCYIGGCVYKSQGKGKLREEEGWRGRKREQDGEREGERERG
jgi:hypothetical protein